MDLSKDLIYGDTLQLMSKLEEVSKLLHAYAAPILNSDFWLLSSYFLTY